MGQKSRTRTKLPVFTSGDVLYSARWHNTKKMPEGSITFPLKVSLLSWYVRWRKADWGRGDRDRDPSPL